GDEVALFVALLGEDRDLAGVVVDVDSRVLRGRVRAPVGFPQRAAEQAHHFAEGDAPLLFQGAQGGEFDLHLSSSSSRVTASSKSSPARSSSTAGAVENSISTTACSTVANSSTAPVALGRPFGPVEETMITRSPSSPSAPMRPTSWSPPTRRMRTRRFRLRRQWHGATSGAATPGVLTS